MPLGLPGLTRHIWRRHRGWAHRKKPSSVHKAGTPGPPEFTGFESVLLPQLLLYSTHKFSKTPLCHYCPSSKPSPFWVQYNRLGLALQKQNVDRYWNGGMAHRGLFISFYLFGRNRSCLTVSRTNVVGVGRGDKPYNPIHLRPLLLQGLTPSYVFSLLEGLPTSSLLTRTLLGQQGSLQNRLLHEVDPDAWAGI